MKCLIEAEKAAKPLIDEIVKNEKMIFTNGIKTQSNGRVVEIPPILNLENSKIFLKFAKQALQYLAAAMGRYWNQNSKARIFMKSQKLPRANLEVTILLSKLFMLIRYGLRSY